MIRVDYLRVTIFFLLCASGTTVTCQTRALFNSSVPLGRFGKLAQSRYASSSSLLRRPCDAIEQRMLTAGYC